MILIWRQEDSVLFASTNYPNKLDEALRRPGRFDVHVPFTHATPKQASDLYKHFYPSSLSSSVSVSVLDEKTSLITTTDQTEVDRRANSFARIISDAGVRVSIAVIQGFLLLYKKDPVMALEKAPAWVEGIKKEQDDISKKSTGHGNGNVGEKAVSPSKSPAEGGAA